MPRADSFDNKAPASTMQPRLIPLALLLEKEPPAFYTPKVNTEQRTFETEDENLQAETILPVVGARGSSRREGEGRQIDH
ncbi:hypothetical protein HDU84_007262 [Entophlyctis sp. JEL0112]|nr:hypothetical protein HDU84_007262 [Entophlyctis sp. JEL0112]